MTDGISIVMSYHNRRIQLIRTLKSINQTEYNKSKLQIIIVNDNSDKEYLIDDLNDLFVELDIFVLNIREKQKNWINPCISYNIGFNHIKYNKVIIQNPECYHQGDIISDVEQQLNDKTYLSYACYSLTPNNSNKNNFNDVEINNMKFEQVLGDGWYNHSIYRPSFFHFCSAISYNNLCSLNGFDERYKDGIGFDDNEIVDRIKIFGLKLKIIDNPFVFHQAHDSVFHYDNNTLKEDKENTNNLFHINEKIYESFTKYTKKYKSITNTFFNKEQPQKLTVLIPFKNREENLKVFIPYFHNFMKNYFSQINYKIVVIEQGNDKLFNKGILFNAGFILTSEDTDYYALHDVDQLPISADYSYNFEPFHLFVNAFEQSNSGLISNYYEKERFQQKGGAITVSKELYSLSNGHSNNYWGWGLIDDDFAFRLYDIGHKTARWGVNNQLGYYVTLNANTKRFFDDDNYKKNYEYATDVINKINDWRLEGLNTTKFTLIDTVVNEKYTKYIIDFDNDVEN